MQKDVESRFEGFYNWRLDGDRFGDDFLLGRLSREFHKGKPRLIRAAKVKTVSRSNQSAAANREKVARGLYFEDADPLIPEEDQDRLRHRLKQYDTLANTWALAGSHKVTYGGQEVVYCHWQDAFNYVQALRAKVEHLVDRFTESSVLSYLERVEEKIRGKAIGEARRLDTPKPWGAALVWALKEHSEEWAENKGVLV